MTDIDTAQLEEGDGPVDGRVARRQRNIDTVLDVVLEMFSEDQLFPTIEQAATRSGLSLRSVYRYFNDPGELLEAAVERMFIRSAPAAHLHAIGEGALARRVDDFVEMRVRLHDAEGASFRATLANAARHERINRSLARVRGEFRDQFARQFEPELAAAGEGRERLLAAGDILTQFDSIDLFRRYAGLSSADTEAAIRRALMALFTSS